jgi:hypothetical protein
MLVSATRHGFSREQSSLIARMRNLREAPKVTKALTRLANGHHANRVGELMPWTAVG